MELPSSLHYDACAGFVTSLDGHLNFKLGFISLLILIKPKLPLNGRIYTLTVDSVLTTNVSQTICQLLLRDKQRAQGFFKKCRLGREIAFVRRENVKHIQLAA